MANIKQLRKSRRWWHRHPWKFKGWRHPLPHRDRKKLDR